MRSLGLGAESQIVAVTTALARWFKGKELSFAFGINLTIARIASIAADNSPTWAKFAFFPNGVNAQPSWHRPLVLAVVVGSTAVIGALVYWAHGDLRRDALPPRQVERAGQAEFPRRTEIQSFVLVRGGAVFHVLLRNLSVPYICHRSVHQQIPIADGCGREFDRGLRCGPAERRAG